MNNHEAALNSAATKPEWAIDGVLRQDLHHVWDDAWPYLERAIERFPQASSKYDEKTVLRELLAGRMQLWIGLSFATDSVTGAVLTEVMTDDRYPGMVFMSIPLLGADNWMKWGDTMWNTLKAWGSAQGCTHALGYGRKGWSRLYGFDAIGKTEDGIDIYIRRLKAH
jgi:hypothetical protein